MALHVGDFQEQSRTRKVFNLLGIIIVAVVFLELFLRGLGVLVSVRILNPSQHSSSADQTNGHIILCIGDSWTAGQSSENYPYALQEKLLALFPEMSTRVINLGAGGFNSSQGLRRLTDNLPIYQPDIVIVFIGNNDHWNLSESVYWQFADQRLDHMSIWKAKMRVFLHSLRVYKFIRILSYKIRGIPTPNEFYAVSPDQQATEADHPVTIDRVLYKKQLEYNLLKFIELSKVYDFTLIFQTYFHFHGYHVNEIIRDIAVTYRIPFVDNNIFFHEKIAVEDREKYLIPDGHPNPTGYRFIADHVIDVLQQEKIYP